MRKGALDHASALMEQAYDATPPEQRARPLVLNRAILDLTQRVHVMRAVRDVCDYLRAHAEPDEQAQNILGAALHIAADTPRWKKAVLWQSAVREWERRNEQMNQSRPGFRRWGPHWLDEQQYEDLEGERAQLEDAIDAQADRVARAATRVEALQSQYAALGASAALARAQAESIRAQRLAEVQLQQQRYERWQQQQRQKQPQSLLSPPGQPAAPAQQPAPAASDRRTLPPLPPPAPAGVFIDTTGVAAAQARRAADVIVARRDLAAERNRLAELKAALAAIRPAWPTTFDAIDPAALTAPPPPPPDPKHMAALVKQSAAVAAQANSPFAGSGTSNDPRAPQQHPPAPAPRDAAPSTTAPASQPSRVPFAPRAIDKRNTR